MDTMMMALIRRVLPVSTLARHALTAHNVLLANNLLILDNIVSALNFVHASISILMMELAECSVLLVTINVPIVLVRAATALLVTQRQIGNSFRIVVHVYKDSMISIYSNNVKDVITLAALVPMPIHVTPVI
eukprot:GHVR01042690.1.p1 GENE.GHVR01042690.1~~GHVR01042690.1.p1  ORF type:complete len:132 (-),score=0.29 GHVR01042690.1:386-781(-)